MVSSGDEAPSAALAAPGGSPDTLAVRTGPYRSGILTPFAASPAMAKSPSSNHRWSFYRAGGVDQVRLDTAEDVFHLDQLDQKLWVALSCPVDGLEFDRRTLQLLDADGDAHVRPPEILEASRWLRAVLKNGDDLLNGRDGVRLDNIRTDTDDGQAVRASAERVLVLLEKETSEPITVADAEASVAKLDQTEWNGDGIVPPDAIASESARKTAEDIVACLGGVPDRSGKPGFDLSMLDAFFDECAAFDAWMQAGESNAAATLPFGDQTNAAIAAMNAVRAKIDDFFARCRLAAYDARSLAVLNREESEYVAAAAGDLSFDATEVSHFPLALIAPGKALPLSEGVHPAWAKRLAAFQALCVPGHDSLGEKEWVSLGERVAAHLAWIGEKKGSSVECLGIARVREILRGKTRAILQAAIDEDLRAAPAIAGLGAVEKLARLQRDFHRLLNNYVSFSDFYARRGAIFQAGTLHMDGRALDLCFRVLDPAKHATLAAMSRTYLAYLDCTRHTGEKLAVACAFTAGDRDNLFVGRNGIFYDREGKDWDATIAKIIDNPISVRQAFWSPYKKVVRWIEESAAKRAAAADEASVARLQQKAEATGDAAKSGEARKSKFDVGVVAALGVAVGGITAALSGFFGAILGLGVWIPLGVIGILLAISGPAMLLAWFKLRQRNLGPILDANGWAVNTLTRINLPLGGSLTAMPKLPEGARRSLVDPYAPRKSLWPRLLLLLLVLGGTGYGLYRYNFLHRWFPDHVPAYISKGFDGPSEAVAGTESIELTLGSGAASVTVTVVGKARAFPVAVVDKRIKIPAADLEPGDLLAVTDPKSGASHMIAIIERQ